MADLTVWQRADRRWAWHLKADNGQIVATDGNQGYENEADCQSMADRVIQGEFRAAKRWRTPLPG